MVEETQTKADDTTEKLTNILIKKDQTKKIDKDPLSNNKQKQVVMKKQGTDDSYRRKFVESVLAKIPEIIVAEKGNKIVLKWNNKSICRLMTRVNSRFTAYRKPESTFRIKTTKDEADLLQWIEQKIVALKTQELTHAPKTKK